MHIMNQLFSEFEKNQIQYAHFKSNTNLDYSFLDTGDFDVVVDPARQDDILKILTSLKAKQMNTVAYKRYPGVDNWLLFDSESGRIHHLHMHYQLMSGKKYVKEYEIPWRDIVFETRIYDETWKLYISNPNIELLLLSVRCVIKAHLKDYGKAVFGLYKTHGSLQKERADLLSKVDENSLKTMISKVFPDLKEVDVFYNLITSSVINSHQFLKLSKVVRRELAIHRRFSGWTAWWMSLWRSIEFYYIRLSRKFGFNQFKIQKKTCLSEGAVFAFVGVDGAGKSTTAKEIYKWLSKQFDCSRIYTGMGDGKTTLWNSLLKKGRKALGGSQVSGSESINSVNRPKRDPVSFGKNPAFFIKKRLLLSAIYSVEKENRKKIIAMNKYRINGGITILDRYPQLELPNVNDGPKFERYKTVIKADKFIDKMVKKELKQMSIVREVKPDIVFRINITAEESMRRKTDQSDITVCEAKIADLQKITFQNTRIIDINGMQPYEDELLEIKRLIWDNM